MSDLPTTTAGGAVLEYMPAAISGLGTMRCHGCGDCNWLASEWDVRYHAERCFEQ